MKKIIYILITISAFVFISLTGCGYTSGTVMISSRQSYQDQSYPAFSDLDSYGQWINEPGLGTCWRPNDESNWQPYADGQWVWTDDGWMWDSNEPYGWIVYHYGYWQYTDFDGWVWVPSYDWAPARVRWYHSNGYVGWAPLPPPSVNVNYIYDDRHYSHVWVVVREQNFAEQNVHEYHSRSYIPDSHDLRSNDGGRAPDVKNIQRVSTVNIQTVRPVRQPMQVGDKQLIKVRVRDEKPFSPSTVRDQSNQPQRNSNAPNTSTPNTSNPPAVRIPPTNPPAVNDQRPPSNQGQRPPSNQDQRPPSNQDQRPPSNQDQRHPTDQNVPPKNNGINTPQNNAPVIQKDRVRENNIRNNGNTRQPNTVDRNKVKRNEPAVKKGEVKNQKIDRSQKGKNERDQKKVEKKKEPSEEK